MATLNKYEYVDTGGKLRTFEAADSATAQRMAPGIAKNSGVMLVPGKITSTANVPKAQVGPPSTATTESQRNAAFTSSPNSGRAPLVSTQNGAPVTTTQLYQATNLPDASTFAASQPRSNFSQQISGVAKATLSSTGQSIDELLAQRQVENDGKIETAQAGRDRAEKDIRNLAGRTDAQDALKDIYRKFEVDKTIRQLKEVQQKTVAAQEALNMGLIFEGDRPVRMSLLSGRSASLQKQGLAVIGALQGTAQVLQGNIDLARSYAATTIDAINADNTRAMNAYNTLLTLYDNDLIEFNTEERNIVTNRLQALKDQNTILEQNKKDVADLMVEFPTAFLSGGVSLLDTKEQALQKMLPKMSEMEMTKFTFSTTRAASGSSGSDADGKASDKQLLLSLKNPLYTIQPGDDIPAIARAKGISADQIRRLNPGVNEGALQPGQTLTLPGMSYEEALNSFSDTVSDAWIQSVYREGNEPKGIKDQLEEAAFSTYINPATGGLREGFTPSLSAKGELTMTDNNDYNGDGKWWNPFTWGKGSPK